MRPACSSSQLYNEAAADEQHTAGNTTTGKTVMRTQPGYCGGRWSYAPSHPTLMSVRRHQQVSRVAQTGHSFSACDSGRTAVAKATGRRALSLLVHPTTQGRAPTVFLGPGHKDNPTATRVCERSAPDASKLEAGVVRARVNGDVTACAALPRFDRRWSTRRDGAE